MLETCPIRGGHLHVSRAQSRSIRPIFRRKQILELFGISNATLYQWIAAGRFPKGIPIGPNTRIWTEDEIDAVVLERTRERDATGDLQPTAQMRRTRATPKKN